MNIKSILICPKCKCELTEELKCEICDNQYTYKHGVYNVISLEFSGNQEYLYKNEISNDINSIFSPEDELRYNETTKHYYSLLNRETNDAIVKQDKYMQNLLNTISGDVCDLATGGGQMLQKLIDCNNASNIVCTDINEFELIHTRLKRTAGKHNIFYVATDGRYISLKNNSFDYITSLSGFGNIPESDKVAKELYRILKLNGKIIIQGEYIGKNSKSYDLAKSVGVERGLVEEFIIEDLKNAGFENVISTIVAEAIWAENPYDLIPAAGDIKRYCIITAQRTKQALQDAWLYSVNGIMLHKIDNNKIAA